MAKTKSLTIVEKEKAMLSERQMAMLVQNTPEAHIKTRKGRGGKQFKYVTGSYVNQRLNEIFGWNWTFEVKNFGKSPNETSVWVLGRLTVTAIIPTKWEVYRGKRILVEQQQMTIATKEQFGGADIKHEKGGDSEVDYADDLKSAATDSMKKCASSLGIAADIYSDEETARMIQAKVSAVTEFMLAKQKQMEEKLEEIKEQNEPDNN